MKRIHAGLVALALAAFAIPAIADPPSATPAAPAASAAPKPSASTPAPAVTTVASATISGRADKPNVLIELQRPTAVSAARDAHQQMREAWMKKLQPSTVRAVR